jgi:hypothetical protein
MVVHYFAKAAIILGGMTQLPTGEALCQGIMKLTTT